MCVCACVRVCVCVCVCVRACVRVGHPSPFWKSKCGCVANQGKRVAYLKDSALLSSICMWKSCTCYSALVVFSRINRYCNCIDSSVTHRCRCWFEWLSDCGRWCYRGHPVCRSRGKRVTDVACSALSPPGVERQKHANNNFARGTRVLGLRLWGKHFRRHAH